jgi:hypothetical protein
VIRFIRVIRGQIHQGCWYDTHRPELLDSARITPITRIKTDPPSVKSAKSVVKIDPPLSRTKG